VTREKKKAKDVSRKTDGLMMDRRYVQRGFPPDLMSSRKVALDKLATVFCEQGQEMSGQKQQISEHSFLFLM
jgi:hypothetical protein